MRLIPENLSIVGAIALLLAFIVFLVIIILDRLEQKITSWQVWAGLISVIYGLTGLDLTRLFRGGRQ
jgi:hypothetical protein